MDFLRLNEFKLGFAFEVRSVVLPVVRSVEVSQVCKPQLHLELGIGLQVVFFQRNLKLETHCLADFNLLFAVTNQEGFRCVLKSGKLGGNQGMVVALFSLRHLLGFRFNHLRYLFVEALGFGLAAAHRELYLVKSLVK